MVSNIPAVSNNRPTKTFPGFCLRDETMELMDCCPGSIAAGHMVQRCYRPFQQNSSVGSFGNLIQNMAAFKPNQFEATRLGVNIN